MLVLTRKKTQSIRIGDEIIIKVLEVKGSTVRIGIEAPGEVPIVREELLVQMTDAAHRLDAASSDSTGADPASSDAEPAISLSAATPVLFPRVRCAR